MGAIWDICLAHPMGVKQAMNNLYLSVPCMSYIYMKFILKRKVLGPNPIDYACNMEIIEAQECEMISPSKSSHQTLDNIIRVLKQLIGCNREYDF